MLNPLSVRGVWIVRVSVREVRNEDVRQASDGEEIHLPWGWVFKFILGTKEGKREVWGCRFGIRVECKGLREVGVTGVVRIRW